MDNETLMRSNYQEIILELQAEVSKYKAVADYFIKEGNQAEKTIVSNILKGW